MNQIISKNVRKLIWSAKQPLTKKPFNSSDIISDLFVWRNSKHWATFFELINIPALFNDESTSQIADLVFFDVDGKLVGSFVVDVKPNIRTTLDLTDFIDVSYGEYGTFAVFHSETPQMLANFGSHLAERGYVSYCYKGTEVRSYVHGNLDAIA